MAGLTLGEVAVHEVEIADESAIVEGSSIGRCLAAADQSCEGLAAEIVEMGADIADRLAVQRTDGDTNAIKDALAKFIASVLGHGRCIRRRNKSTQTPHFGVF